MHDHPTTPYESETSSLPGALSFRYLDEESELSTLRATDLEQVLEGLRELTSIYARSGGFDEGSVVEPELRISPPRHGSFLFDVTWVAPYFQDYLNNQADELTTAGLGSAGAGVLLYLKAKIKEARTVATAQRRLEDGNWEVSFSDGSTLTLSPAVMDAFNRSPKRSKKALNKLLVPLAHDADYLEVSSSEGVEEALAGRDDYVATIPEPEEDEVPTDYDLQFETPVRKVEFDGDRNWYIRIPETGYRNAALSTPYRTPIGPNDTFTLRVHVTHVESSSGYKKKYSIIEVVDHLSGDSDDSSPDSQASQ